MRAAQLVCCGRYCTQCETPAAYAWRKREIDTADLLELAIENELSQTEREIVTDYWYDALSITQIAESRRITPAAVKNTLERAKNKLERVLTYVVLYQRDTSNCNIVPVVLGRARVIAAAKNSAKGTSGDRILRLRQSQCLSLDSVYAATGIPSKRLQSIEHGAIPETDELISLSDFFSVTTDFILKGETDDKNIV